MNTYGEIAALAFNRGDWRAKLGDSPSREEIYRAGWEASAQAVIKEFCERNKIEIATEEAPAE